jgi:hypothetical protein
MSRPILHFGHNILFQTCEEWRHTEKRAPNAALKPSVTEVDAVTTNTAVTAA